MPFLPMKYPEYRISMEASLPSSVHSWLMHELEQRGIDSLVYTRYIISLLLQDGEDFDGLEADLDSFSSCKRKGRRSARQKRPTSTDEERKKFAAIQCLSAVTDEKSGIETLVEELCSRLKDSEIEAASLRHVVKSRSSSSEGSDDSSAENQNPAQRYYAAFPALHGQGVSTNPSPSDSVWRNNPLVKSHASLTSEEDSSSANEDAEIRKINIPGPIAVPKQRKPRKNSIQARTDNTYKKKEGCRSRGSSVRKGGKTGQKELMDKQDILSWPPGFAKLDPLLLNCFDVWPEDYIEPKKLSPKRTNNELCVKVESLLKGMLLPTPEKTYKDLQDVDNASPTELREKVERKNMISITPTSGKEAFLKQEDPISKTDEEITCADFSDVLVSSPRDDSVSPELQEQEIWYTQPIDVIFQSQDDEVSNSKLRLYKRNSDPAFSPDLESLSELSDGGLPSPLSSPVEYAENRSTSCASDKSEDILEGSLLIPSWLTEVISADEANTEGPDKKNFNLEYTLKSSSPFQEMHLNQRMASLSVYDNCEQLQMEEALCSSQYMDDSSTPTPEEAGNMLLGRPMSVSLVDWDYMSKFLFGEQTWQCYSPEDSFSLQNQRRTCITTLWQSQVLFDYSLNITDVFQCFEDPLLEIYDAQCWQPLGTRSYSQLWDVNMQKRSKMSIWGGQVFCGESQVWFAENTLVFLNDETKCEKDKQEEVHGENTLIPRISIDIIAEENASVFPVEEEDIEPEGFCGNYFDRSISMGDVPSLWVDSNSRVPDPKLSKSFELVPSEHSAFKDVPRKLLHVHSEPNLVQFRQEFGDGDQASASSPSEHLYISPKTHFRPITPAYVPELFTSKSKQQICQDLFGGLPNTKTPYQQFQVPEKENEDESFIPSFKVKNSSKSVQTGESFEKIDSPAVCNETVERDTPETLTISIIEDVIEEKVDQLITVPEDLDGANTDSAYETDYGGNPGAEFEHDLYSHGHCCQGGSFDGDIGLFGIPNVDHGHLGEITNFSVDSFEATYPHTNDWPEVPPNGYNWAVDNDMEKPLEKIPDVEYLDGGAEGSITVGSNHSNTTAGIWNDDLGLDHLYKEAEMEKYKNIWSSASNDYYLFEAGLKTGSAVNENFHNMNEEHELILEGYEEKDFLEYHPGGEGFHAYNEQLVEPPVDLEMPFATYAEFPDHEDLVAPLEKIASPRTTVDDYFSVKLVYKNKKSVKGNQQQSQGYGDCELVPMPGEAVMSSVLEEEWMDPAYRALWAGKKPSSLQRKPCSFYLEGNCRRSDCKFAHDISNITCRFWEEGGCFKGPLCPFLHGYPRQKSPGKDNPSPVEVDKQKFDLSKEEFPELSLTPKNGRNSNIHSGHKKLKLKALKSQKSDSAGAAQREKGRKSNGRRHSNKENQCEVRIVNKCSSSI